MPASRSLEMDMHRLQKRHPDIADEIGHLEEFESFREANDVISGLEMLAYDTGYEGGGRLPRWMLKVGRVLKVDVESLRKGGAEDAGIKESSHFSGEKSMRIEELNLALADIEAALLEERHAQIDEGVPEALRKDERRRERERAQFRAKRRSDMAKAMRGLKHPSVDLDVKTVGNGIAYQVTVPYPEQLLNLPTPTDPVTFVRTMLMFQNIDDPTRTGFTIQDRASGDGVTLLDWESSLDKKWKRLWNKPLSKKEMEQFERIEERRVRFDERYDPEEDDYSPDEDDAYIVDRPRGGYDVSFAGKFLDNVSDYDDAVALIKRESRRQKFWPNLWFIDDHGGHRLEKY
jgi:hypothetical protein